MNLDLEARSRLHELAVDRMPGGMFAIDQRFRLILWNRFMAERSGVSAKDALGQPIFELFPDLPVEWLKRKFQSVFQLKITAFTSWQHRPYLFRFAHDRPITGDIEWMRQDCSFVPLMEGDQVSAVCATIIDVTDLALAQTAREIAVAALREASVRDGLTGLFNRRHGEDRLSQEFARWYRTGRPFSVLIFDLDHFKRINDSYGHPAGDAVLRAVAARASASLRVHDVVGRYGGEEFIVVLPETQLMDAARVAERIRREIESLAVTHSAYTIRLSASIGVAQVADGAETPDDIMRDADAALYQAKSSGRNCVMISGVGALPAELLVERVESATSAYANADADTGSHDIAGGVVATGRVGVRRRNDAARQAKAANSKHND
jgi:diguanylate cyclase (GGDEF)-like protein/PAS domain S-box-containing protein